MVQHKHHKKLTVLYNKIRDIQQWLELQIERRPALKEVYPYDGMSPERTVRLFLVEQGYEVRRRTDPNIDYDIRRPGEGWASIEVKADVLRPGQECADHYAVILYPKRGGRAIILTTLGGRDDGKGKN